MSQSRELPTYIASGGLKPVIWLAVPQYYCILIKWRKPSWQNQLFVDVVRSRFSMSLWDNTPYGPFWPLIEIHPDFYKHLCMQKSQKYLPPKWAERIPKVIPTLKNVVLRFSWAPSPIDLMKKSFPTFCLGSHLNMICGPQTGSGVGETIPQIRPECRLSSRRLGRHLVGGNRVVEVGKTQRFRVLKGNNVENDGRKMNREGVVNGYDDGLLMARVSWGWRGLSNIDYSSIL